MFISYRMLNLSATSLVVLIFCLISRVDAQPKSHEINLNPSSVLTGSSNKISATVTLTNAAQADLKITIASSDESVAVVDKKEVKVSSGGRESEPFFVTPVATSGPKTAKILATLNGQTVEKTFTIVKLLDIQPVTINGGNQLQAVITLPDPSGSPPAPAQVKLYSDSNLIRVPKDPAIVVKPGERVGKVALETVNELSGKDGKGTVTATYGDWSQPVVVEVKYNTGRLLLAILIGVAVVYISFIVFAYLFGQKVSIKSLILGEDGKPSTSKFQNVVWTFVVLFSYASIAFTKLIATGTSNLSITREVVIVMGITIGTRVLAKAITVNQIEDGRVTKSPQLPAQGDLRTTGRVRRRAMYKYLFADDNGRTDLNKIQMLAWTFIAIGIFLYDWYRQLMGTPSGEMNLPTIDGALVVLMGLAQGAYLGGKLVLPDGPAIVNLDPDTAGAGVEFRINGGPFGNIEGRVTATPVSGGDPQQWAVTRWDPTFVRARVPAGQPSGSYEIGVIANGQPSINTKTLKVP